MFQKKEKTKEKIKEKTFLETHEFKIQTDTYCHIRIKGTQYKNWVSITHVLNDFQVPTEYKGTDFNGCFDSVEDAHRVVKLLCEYIMAIERNEIPKHITEGNLHDFYVIENL